MVSECSHDPMGQMRAFLDLQIEEVRDHVTVVSPTELGQNFFLRIDKNVPEVYIPNMPRSAMPSENITTPRVTVAPTLMGCFIGYFRAEYDLVYSGTQNAKEAFHGGYGISALPFELALRPDAALVSDSETSDEHWLVNYNDHNVEFKPQFAGKFFISQITYLNTGGQTRPQIKLQLYLETNLEQMELLPGKKLTKGYYAIDVFWESLLKRSVSDPQCVTAIKPIDREVYLAQKTLSANLLALEDFGGKPIMPAELPEWMRW